MNFLHAQWNLKNFVLILEKGLGRFWAEVNGKKEVRKWGTRKLCGLIKGMKFLEFILLQNFCGKRFIGGLSVEILACSVELEKFYSDRRFGDKEIGIWRLF